MKKLTLFMSAFAADVDAELTLLGKLGVMHMLPFQSAKDESIGRVESRIKELEKAIVVLDEYDNSLSLEAVEIEDFSVLERGEIQLMEKVLKLDDERVQLEQKITELTSALQWYKEWGNILASDIEQLKNYDTYIRLYLVSDRDLKSLSQREDLQYLGQIEKQNQVLLLTQDAEAKLNFEEVNRPQIAFNDIKNQFDARHSQLTAVNIALVQLHRQKKLLQLALDERNRRLDVRHVQYGGLSIDHQLRCWKGFIPEDVVNSFVETAEKYSWGYIIEEPLPEEMDEVPTLIETSRWVARIRPVMNFMGLVPAYNGLDVSKVFMIFFTFFTGILVGDAGYGLVFLLLTVLVHRKQNFARKVGFDLMYTLTASIMFWGIITGTYFGAEAIAEIPFLNQLKISKIASFGGDSLFTQKLMFIIGVVHLTIGHLQAAWRYRKSVRAIGQLGWVAIVWGLYLIVNQMVLEIEAPGIMLWLFIGGISLVALFSNPGTSFFKGVLTSLANLPLSIIDGFSDVISYIRLYAVGLSTVLMASTFNDMALGSGISTVAAAIGAVLILILGHGLNMILAAMSVLVHAVRLNMLEYAGHAGVEFSGSEYTPFTIKNSINN